MKKHLAALLFLLCCCQHQDQKRNDGTGHFRPVAWNAMHGSKNDTEKGASSVEEYTRLRAITKTRTVEVPDLQDLTPPNPTALISRPLGHTNVGTGPQVRQENESLARYLDAFEQDFEKGRIDNEIPGAAVVMVMDGRVILQKGFGVKKRGTTDAVDEHTVFRLGSVSKGFASVLAGIMVEQGAIAWDDPVSRYIKEFKLNDAAQTDRVQIQHVLSHTSGLPRHAYTNLIEDGLSLERIIPKLEQVPLIAKEGDQLAYQNVAYAVTEHVLETQSATNFNTLLHEKLFVPLGMDHSSASYSSIQDSKNVALPHMYQSRSRGRVPTAISKKYYNAVSAGGINASASDMGAWLLLLTGYRPDVITQKTLQEIYHPRVTIHNRRFSKYWEGVNKSHYGLGWRILDNHGQKVVYHGGYVNGYRSEIAFAPEEGIGICILINTHSSYALEVIPSFFNYLKSASPSESTL